MAYNRMDHVACVDAVFLSKPFFADRCRQRYLSANVSVLKEGIRDRYRGEHGPVRCPISMVYLLETFTLHIYRKTT